MEYHDNAKFILYVILVTLVSFWLVNGTKNRLSWMLKKIRGK